MSERDEKARGIVERLVHLDFRTEVDTDNAVQIVRRLLREAEKNGWQPIATAPKDGRWLRMFWRDGDGNELYEDDIWSDDQWQVHAQNYEHYLIAAPVEIPFTGAKEQPPYTHWYEVPEAPNC